MRLIGRFARRAAALVARAWLALRYWRQLGYSWRLAWITAERA